MSDESLSLGIDYGRMFLQPPLGVPLDDLLERAGVLSSQDLTYPVDLGVHGNDFNRPSIAVPFRVKSFPGPREFLQRNLAPV